MKLTTIYFKSDDGFVKAIVRESEIDFFKPLGKIYSSPEESLTSPKLEEKKKVKKETKLNLNPDKGFGAPGSLDFHAHSVMGSRSVNDIVSYVKDVTGEVIESSGSLKQVKTNAIKEIERWLDNGKDK